MMLLRQEVLCVAETSQVDNLKDQMDEAAMTVLECSQTLMTDSRYKPWMWLFSSTHQSYVMAYVLTRLVERQARKHASRMRAFVDSLCWQTWLDGLQTTEHRYMLTKFRSQMQSLDSAEPASEQPNFAVDAVVTVSEDLPGPTLSVSAGQMSHTSLFGFESDLRQPITQSAYPLTHVGPS
jgi:hypothetical protein